MATIIEYEVKKYAATLFSGTNLRFNQRIFLYRADGNFAAEVYFYEEGVTMPPPSGPAASGSITLTYRSNRFDSVMDILRNEKPVYVYYDEGGGNGGIATHVEPVGEGENKS